MIRCTVRYLCALLLTVSAFVSLTGVAHADVIVRPGASGSVCSGYSYIQVNPSNVYWQTCAWADNNEVYFTVNFGNAGSGPYTIDQIYLNYIKSGSFQACPRAVDFPFTIPARSTKSTPTATCAIPRVRAAYAAHARVITGNYDFSQSSDTLQVQ